MHEIWNRAKGISSGTGLSALYLEAHLVQGSALDLWQLEGLQRLAAGAAVQVETDTRLTAACPPPPLLLASCRDPGRLRSQAADEYSPARLGYRGCRRYPTVDGSHGGSTVVNITVKTYDEDGMCPDE